MICSTLYIRSIIKIYVDNKLIIILAKNPTDHEGMEYIDTRFYFIKFYIKNKK